MTDLASILRAEGVTVVEENGWRTYCRPGSFDPAGVMVHHTAGHKDLAVVIAGRPDLKGPLANTWLSQQGVAHLISAGRCNHAGSGAAVVYAEVQQNIAPSGTAAALHLTDHTDGNTRFYGIEVENLGDGHDAYPVAQVQALVGICAALCRHHGWGWQRVIGHKEWTARKIDPTLDMNQLRQFVAGRLAAPQEDDVTPQDIEAIADRVVAKLTDKGGALFTGKPDTVGALVAADEAAGRRRGRALGAILEHEGISDPNA